jgi:hypothetical protein
MISPDNPKSRCWGLGQILTSEYSTLDTLLKEVKKTKHRISMIESQMNKTKTVIGDSELEEEVRQRAIRYLSIGTEHLHNLIEDIDYQNELSQQLSDFTKQKISALKVKSILKQLADTGFDEELSLLRVEKSKKDVEIKTLELANRLTKEIQALPPLINKGTIVLDDRTISKRARVLGISVEEYTIKVCSQINNRTLLEND